MTITEQTTITEIAGAVPASVRVFQRYGIDFCCGGKRPIGTVCEEHGLSFDELAQEIAQSSAHPSPDVRDWSKASPSALIEHILTRYHEPLKRELPRIEAMAAKVARVHGTKAPYLSRIDALVTELSADLTTHMQKEERVLFPIIDALDADVPPPMPLSAPIRVMVHEHDRAGELLGELRQITSGYEPPDWACNTFRALYAGLAELEADMHVHVHLENNILFPRAIALADKR